MCWRNLKYWEFCLSDGAYFRVGSWTAVVLHALLFYWNFEIKHVLIFLFYWIATFRMFWDGGWEQGLFHKHFLFYFVCVKYKDYNLIVKNNKMKITTTIKKKRIWGTSLVAQWLRIRLPMQGTRVRALVREDPTCRGATKPMHHNYWACALEPTSHNYWAHVLQLLKPTRLEPVLHNKRSHHNEKPMHCNEE